MIRVSYREGPDPNGVDPLAPMNHGRVSGHRNRMRRRPWADRSREGAVGSEETIMLDSNLPSVPRRDPWNKGRTNIGDSLGLANSYVWIARW
jgi:hypothetical protein